MPKIREHQFTQTRFFLEIMKAALRKCMFVLKTAHISQGNCCAITVLQGKHFNSDKN